MNENSVIVENLTRRFGRFTAVDSISFSMKPGEILGFLGPNGAGKTTTIKMMTGLLRITSGDVRIKGKDVKKELKSIKRFTGYMSQKFSLYPLLTGFENIEFFGGISGLSRKEIKRKINEIREYIPEEYLNRKIKELPPGIKQQVALFACLLPDPEVIFLDEPTSGVDPVNRRQFWMQINGLKRRNKSILVSTHNLDEAEFADRILIIHKGDIVAEGNPSDLKEQGNFESIEELFEKAVSDEKKN
ncbi:MAG: ABC transporter ATP-binding protein [Candidatus Aminicenantes bacterium]|nr:ABC transporter ATP-binding protein [Candidatus Aminicenantes bacterium]